MPRSKLSATIALLLSSFSTSHEAATSYEAVSISAILNGVAPSHAEFVGRYSSRGVDFHSVYDRQSDASGDDCIGLLLSDRDRRREDSMNGRIVRVRAWMIPADELQEIFPEFSGQLDGRFWGGTLCQARYVGFVHSIIKVN